MRLLGIALMTLVCLWWRFPADAAAQSTCAPPAVLGAAAGPTLPAVCAPAACTMPRARGAVSGMAAARHLSALRPLRAAGRVAAAPPRLIVLRRGVAER